MFKPKCFLYWSIWVSLILEAHWNRNPFPRHKVSHVGTLETAKAEGWESRDPWYLQPWRPGCRYFPSMAWPELALWNLIIPHPMWKCSMICRYCRHSPVLALRIKICMILPDRCFPVCTNQNCIVDKIPPKDIQFTTQEWIPRTSIAKYMSVFTNNNISMSPTLGTQKYYSIITIISKRERNL